ncbi:hypothetical protein DCAR_0522254 [Daucus carota subsp. sativus]|uniref:Uncharacterized protein n=1 Tax=Daucus carota subsp. sativus TaxID=79200 RepID=A0A162A4S9_DAUCS|nr:hypothetical protein DCAR_0522254 [Daucus carota subsp. sativus]
MADEDEEELDEIIFIFLDAAASQVINNPVISLTTKPSDIDLVAAQCSDAETAASNEVDASQKTEEAGQVDEVEAAMKNEGGVVSENVNDTGKSTLEAVVVENKETAAANDYEVDAPETKAIQEDQMHQNSVDAQNSPHTQTHKNS